MRFNGKATLVLVLFYAAQNPTEFFAAQNPTWFYAAQNLTGLHATQNPTTFYVAQLPLDPIHETGQSVTAAYEGWFRNGDGTFSLLVGYFNRNLKEALDIPIGADNRIDPGGPDQGQPTHFLPRRQWGVFTIAVPADFGDKKLTWTLVAHGKSTAIPMGLNPLYEVEPYKEAAHGNTPPCPRA